MTTPVYIEPDWPRPARVKCLITTRAGGASRGPYATFNLAQHVNDRVRDVAANRARLVQRLGLRVSWLSQVHGTGVIELAQALAAPAAVDGASSRHRGVVCAVLTADCLPVLLCDKAGRRVAAVHGGWRGLARGILVSAVKRFESSPEDLLVYLGPAISQAQFEVGVDVLRDFERAQAQRNFSQPVHTAFRPSATADHKYHADLYALARSELRGLGVSRIYGGDYCTFADKRFYSHRRDGLTGRMASLIWLAG